VKLDVDTLPTVPDDPPEAGPDRALEPPPPEAPLPGPGCPDAAEGDDVAEGDVGPTEGDVAQPAASPITAAAMTHPVRLFDSNRRPLDQRACLAMDTEADWPGEDAGGGPVVALVTGRAGKGSWGLVGS
jgi:hypothetical protein